MTCSDAASSAGGDRRGDRPRIAFVTSVYDQISVGGGTFVTYLRRAVEEGKLDMTFFSDDIAEPDAAYEHRVDVPAAVRAVPAGWLTRAWYYSRAVRRVHGRRAFDLIWHNNVITSAFDGWTKGWLPLVGMINDYTVEQCRTPFARREQFGAYRSSVRYAWRQLERHTARKASFVVVNSDYMVDHIRTAYKLPEHRMKRLYKGVDLTAFPFAPHEIARDPVRMLFVKRDYRTGGLPSLLAALAGLPFQVRLTVAGPPRKEHAAITSMARAVAPSARVDVVGAIGRARMPALFSEHDVLCVPSNFEALGVTLMEALASGIPVVSTNVGGVPEVLAGGRAGWLARPGEPNSIRTCLLQVVDDAGMRQKKVEYGRTHVKHFSHERMLENTLDLAREMTRQCDHSVETA